MLTESKLIGSQTNKGGAKGEQMGRQGIDAAERAFYPDMVPLETADSAAVAERDRLAMPTMRIVRPVNSRDGLNYPVLTEFVDDLGRSNYDRGFALSVGSMACTYVTAREMEQMVADKYTSRKFTSDAQEKKFLTDIYRGLAKSFTLFVRAESRLAVQEGFCEVTSTQERHLDLLLGREPTDEKTDDDEIEVRRSPFQPIPWGTSEFVVRGLEKYGPAKLGLDLTGNEVLVREREEVVSFLRSEGYRTATVDRNRDMHISIFRTFGKPLPVLRYEGERPDVVVLDPPKAIGSL